MIFVTVGGSDGVNKEELKKVNERTRKEESRDIGLYVSRKGKCLGAKMQHRKMYYMEGRRFVVVVMIWSLLSLRTQIGRR